MRTERLRYFLLLAAVVIVSAALTNSLMVAVILFAPELNRLLVPTMVQGNRRLLGIFVWGCCVLVLAAAYYLADLLLFPRSTYASHRERDAIVMAIVGMVGGFATIYWMPASRAGAGESSDT